MISLEATTWSDDWRKPIILKNFVNFLFFFMLSQQLLSPASIEKTGLSWL